jgi:MerR family copper efflux transcriptional regulator
MSTVLPIAGARASDEGRRPTLRIGDLAKRTHKSTRAVRLYEEMGLLGSVYRTEGGHRVYGDEVLTRMTWIDKLQSLGFSLTQIKGILEDWSDSQNGPAAMARVRELFREKLEETRVQVRQLQALAVELDESLAYLESCGVCHPSTVLGSCVNCSHPHPVDHEPTLVAGLYASGRTPPE